MLSVIPHVVSVYLLMTNLTYILLSSPINSINFGKQTGPTYSKLSDIRELICEKFNFRKLGVSATEIAIIKEN